MVFEYRLAECPGSWLTVISPVATLEEMRGRLSEIFGGRLIDVRERHVSNTGFPVSSP